eukprot:PITA_03505
MTDLGHLHYFLGLQVLQSKEGISLSQSKYACDLLCHFDMEDCKPAPSAFQSGVKLSVTCTSPEVDATLYRQLVGKLLYLTHTRPDLSFVVGLVAQFVQTPRESHWKAAKRILRYVRGIVQFAIHYSAEASPLLVGFTDSDWAGDPDDRKSTTGYVFTLGSGPITWACKKQAAISLSSVEAEYRGAVEARRILAKFGQLKGLRALDLIDNQLSGSIPMELGQLKALQALDFRDNKLSDSIIVELGMLQTVKSLALEYNNFTGSIPR